MLNYLYYKLYQFALRSQLWDISEFAAPVFIGGLISVNILVLNGFLANIHVLPFLFSKGKPVSAFVIMLIIFSMIYFRKKRRVAILEKYAQESNKARIRGNIIVGIYVAISFLSIYAVAFFKPDKL